MPPGEDDWLLVGKIAGAFGVRGEVKVELLTDFPDRFAQIESVYLGDARVEHRICGVRNHKHVLLDLEGVDGREQAQRMRGTLVWVPRSEAVELPDGEYYPDDIIGLEIVTDQGAVIGRIRDILSTGANDVYVVDADGRELLVPAIRDVVTEIDLKQGRITIHVMDGLLE